MRFVGSLAVLVALWSSAAAATPREELADAARAFDEAALRSNDDSTQQLFVRRWPGPFKLAVRNGSRSPSLVAPSIKAVRAIADVANIEVGEVDISDKTADFILFFDENGKPMKNNCEATIRWNGAGKLTHAEIRINPSLSTSLDNCVIHEAMHAFGFISHPHGADSVLSYVYKRTSLTPLDVNLIKTLYDPALKLGTAPLTASVQSCQTLAGRMASSDADRQAVCDPHKRAERVANGESFLLATATLKRIAGKCAERVTYWANLYPDRVSFGYVDTWRTFKADAAGVYGGSFTVDTKPKPLDFKLSGNLKSGIVSVENLTQGCAWEGTLN